jgi:hypothetical protein
MKFTCPQIGKRNAVIGVVHGDNVAPLELGEERRLVTHGFVTAVDGTCTFNFWQNAAKRGSFLLGGDLLVNRLGFGAMRLTGEGIWGWPPDRENAKKVLRRTLVSQPLDCDCISASFYPQSRDCALSAKYYASDQISRQ